MEFRGLSFTPSSLQIQVSQTCAVPTLGSFVVNGKLDVAASSRVAALNRVVFPVLVLPIMPSVNRQTPPILLLMFSEDKTLPWSCVAIR
jgi:hypothetical protein